MLSRDVILAGCDVFFRESSSKVNYENGAIVLKMGFEGWVTTVPLGMTNLGVQLPSLSLILDVMGY